MSWFCRRRPFPYTAPLQIVAFEWTNRTVCQDYSREQWRRFNAWKATVEHGLSWKRLDYTRALVTNGAVTDWPADSEIGVHDAETVIRRRAGADQPVGVNDE